MNKEYSDYLNSEDWKSKRSQRLLIANFKCAACRSSKCVQVHHLTYARIFNEDMADLMPLCEPHHKAAEDLIARGKLTRFGDPLFLSLETIRLLLSEEKKAEPPKIQKPIKKSRPPRRHPKIIQQELMSEEWMIRALLMPREQFKRLVKIKFGSDDPVTTANAFVVYDRESKRIEAYNAALIKKFQARYLQPFTVARIKS